MRSFVRSSSVRRTAPVATPSHTINGLRHDQPMRHAPGHWTVYNAHQHTRPVRELCRQAMVLSASDMAVPNPPAPSPAVLNPLAPAPPVPNPPVPNPPVPNPPVPNPLAPAPP